MSAPAAATGKRRRGSEREVARPKLKSEAPAPRPDQDDLADTLEAVRALLEHAASARGGDRGPRPEIVIRPHSPLDRLRQLFGLSAFEVRLLALALSVELVPEAGRSLAAINGDPLRPWPTFALALALLPGGHWDAFAPGGPLRGCRLIALGEGEVLSERPVRIDERVLHALMGVRDLDPRLGRRLRRVADGVPLAPGQEAVAQQVARLLGGPSAPHIHLWSATPAVAQAVAARACARLGRVLYVLDGGGVPLDPTERDELGRLWDREAALAPVALLLDLDAAGGDRALERAMLDLALRVAAPVLLGGREPLPELARSVLRVAVPRPLFDEQLHLWQEALGGLPRPSEAELRSLAAQFQVDAGAISSACEELRVVAAAGEVPAPGALLWEACRARARPRLGDLAQHVVTRPRLEDLVLPEPQRRAVRALLGHARQRATVEHAWGFGARGERGCGTSVLFAGPSGTGKTLAAEVIAGVLGLDLYRIDLSAVVSKYIGETEQNLRRVFDAAEAGGAVLLFDEADALFGRRTEVKDSHDRHANIEVSYLLQRMEAYGGLAILTTNLRANIDDAFLRRLPFVIDFPFPDAELRERIWRAIFPPRTPLEALDYTRLARLSIAGGNIRSIARNAAYLAADAGTPVTMRVLMEATRLEYSKLGRSLPPDEVRGWVQDGAATAGAPA